MIATQVLLMLTEVETGAPLYSHMIDQGGAPATASFPRRPIPEYDDISDAGGPTWGPSAPPQGPGDPADSDLMSRVNNNIKQK